MLTRVQTASTAVLGPGAAIGRIVVEPPRDPTHGDMATNAAMVLAKDAGKKPRELAENIAAKLRADDKVASVDVAGPGFINLSLKPNVWGEELLLALAQGADYGRSDIGKGEKVNVEYVSANPTGPMHVGHGRGAVFGDALANLLLFVGSMLRANTTSTMRVRRWTCWRALLFCVTARRSERISARFPMACIPATI